MIGTPFLADSADDTAVRARDACAGDNAEELSVYEQLGDMRSRALTMGNIAYILLLRGQIDEALRLSEERVLIYERLGHVRDLVVGRTKLAMTLLRRGNGGDRDEAARLLQLALTDALRLDLPEAQQIEQILRVSGLGTAKTPTTGR
jgi:hypothetical protein